MDADFLVNYQGSVTGIQPVSERGKAWFQENVETEGWQHMGRYVYGDTRQMAPLLAAVEDEGFTVSPG